MGRVRQNAGRPKKYAGVKCKVMILPAHLHGQIIDFVMDKMTKEIAEYRDQIRNEIKDPEAERKEAERMAMMKERKRLKRLERIEMEKNKNGKV